MEWLLIGLFWALWHFCLNRNAKESRALWPDGDPSAPWWARH